MTKVSTMTTSAVKPDLDELAERLKVSMSRAAHAAFRCYSAAPEGERGQYLRRLMRRLNDMADEVLEKL